MLNLDQVRKVARELLFALNVHINLVRAGDAYFRLFLTQPKPPLPIPIYCQLDNILKQHFKWNMYFSFMKLCLNRLSANVRQLMR